MTMLSEAKDYRRVADEVQLADSPSITPADLIAVKCLLGWSSVRLSSRLGTTYGTLQKFILGRKIARPFKVPEVLAALKAYGIEFVADEGGGGAGVRLRKTADRE